MFVESFEQAVEDLLAADEFGLVEAVDALGEAVVIRIADAADRWAGTDLGEGFGTEKT